MKKKTHADHDAFDRDPWETGELGRSMEHAKVVPEQEAKGTDEALGLQLISIRLQRDLITNLKKIAEYRGIGYQPLIRDLLNRFVAFELKDILTEQLEEAKRQAEAASLAAGGAEGPVSKFLESERKRA